MSDTNMSQTPEDQLPQEVVAELRKQLKSPVTVPSNIDEAILADARAVLMSASRPDRRRFGWRRWTLGIVSVGSLAAALVIAISPQNPMGEGPAIATRDAVKSVSDQVTSSSAIESTGLKEDFDQNGSVNILDALALARRISDANDHSADQLSAGDLNGDGVVDRSDVDLIAMTAVML